MILAAASSGRLLALTDAWRTVRCSFCLCLCHQLVFRILCVVAGEWGLLKCAEAIVRPLRRSHDFCSNRWRWRGAESLISIQARDCDSCSSPYSGAPVALETSWAVLASAHVFEPNRRWPQMMRWKLWRLSDAAAAGSWWWCKCGSLHYHTTCWVLTTAFTCRGGSFCSKFGQA